MLKYLKEFQDHSHIVVKTVKEDYKLVRLVPNKLEDGKDEIHIKINNSSSYPEETIFGVIGLYNFKLRKNGIMNLFESMLGRVNRLSVYVLFTSQEDKLNILLKPIPSSVKTVQDLIEELQNQIGGVIELNGKYINPSLDMRITRVSDLSHEELTHAIKVTGF